MCKVSVIIPTFNRANLISRAINSVLCQTMTDLEIIVIDDGSTDDTDTIISHFSDPRIRYIKHSHCQGASIARNMGIEIARAPYIAFLDSDDEWLPDKLAFQLDIFEKSCVKQLGAVNCSVINLNDERKQAQIWHPAQRGQVFEDQLGLQPYYDTASMWLFKRHYMDQLTEWFDPNMLYAQMSDFLTRLARNCQFDYVEVPLVIFHDHNQEPRNEKYPLETRIKAYDCYVEKHQDELKRHPIQHASVLMKRAHRLLLAGEQKAARSDLIAALRIMPLNFAIWRMIPFTLLDIRVYSLLRICRDYFVGHQLLDHSNISLNVDTSMGQSCLLDQDE